MSPCGEASRGLPCWAGAGVLGGVRLWIHTQVAWNPHDLNIGREGEVGRKERKRKTWDRMLLWIGHGLHVLEAWSPVRWCWEVADLHEVGHNGRSLGHWGVSSKGFAVVLSRVKTSPSALSAFPSHHVIMSSHTAPFVRPSSICNSAKGILPRAGAVLFGLSSTKTVT